MKVYLVTEGSYSDYHIVGVYQSREVAEEMVRLLKLHRFSNDADVEEWEVGSRPDIPADGRRLFWVVMQDNGETITVQRSTYFEEPRMKRGPGRVTWEGWANDKEHAVKIASEQRVMFLAKENT